MQRILTAALLASLACSCLHSPVARGQVLGPQSSEGTSKGRSWAVLIGVEQYHRVPPLRYTSNDVNRLADTLRARGGYSDESILTMTDRASNPRFQPLRASMKAELTDWLNRPGPEDQILVYFSGHGFRDAQGRLYLCPQDFDRADPTGTGIAVTWLREKIKQCKARFKLLLLDACHAGSEKGNEDKDEVAAGDLGDPFKELTGVVTLASSKANERSQIWEEKQQSLFSYWLNQGLKGHADDNGDGVVDVDELNDYVHRKVTQTAEDKFPVKQTPVRIIGQDVPGKPEVLRLRPQTLKQLLSEIAEQLADGMSQEHLGKVGVLPFTSDTPVGEFIGANYGALGHWCARELEDRLMDRGEGQFSVLDQRRLLEALKTEDFGIAQLGSSDALKELSNRVGGLPVIAVGTLRGRAGRLITLQCRLTRTDSGLNIGSAGGSAALSESEWAMLGHSAVVKPEDRRPELPPDDRPVRPVEDQVVERLDRRSEGPHPLLDLTFRFRVRIIVGGEERQGTFQGNKYLVPVHIGEELAIDVENNSGRRALLRLLIDGLNTLPERVKGKAIGTTEVAPRVNLNEARAWQLDPKIIKVNRIAGYATKTEAQGEWRKFTVVRAEKSLAGQKKFTDQLGLITAAFYAVRGSRGIGADAGEAEEVDLTEGETWPVGDLLGVVHIYYVDADELQAGPKQ